MPVIRVAAGNFLEMYDFMVFGYYATSIGRAFFPEKNESASLMLSLATFGVGFLMRPLGALVLGAYIDRRGRRAGLILTLALMSLGTLSIACTPGLREHRHYGPCTGRGRPPVAGLLRRRRASAVYRSYLSEIATPGHKGFYVSWQSASQQCAVIFAALLGVTLNSLLSGHANGRLGLARAVRGGLPHYSAALPASPILSGDRGLPRTQAASFRQTDFSNHSPQTGALS